MLILLLILVAIGLFFLVREVRRPGPSVRLLEEHKGIGRSTAISIAAADLRGLKNLSATLEQNGQKYPVFADDYGKAGPASQTREVKIGTQEQKDLKDGEVTLHVEARNKNWFNSRAAFDRKFIVRSNPPAISVHTGLVYVNQAGSELVIYDVSPGTVSSGVRVGSYFFPGFPLPGGKGGDRMAFWAFPYDLPLDVVPQVVARDDVDIESTAPMQIHLFAKKFRHRDIPLDDKFIKTAVPAILQHTPEMKDTGDPLKNFIMVNNELRKLNRAKIADIGKDTVPEFLWQGAFQQLSNSAVESQFADFRSYIYEGKKVDEAVHLGFDLAVVTHGPVAAANSGRVVFAEYLGIFGNAIIIDHGFGVQTIYAHLNSFKIKVGDKVTKGQIIADSDSTGLAGGDHLHYSTLLDGVEVNAVEWWDQHWIDKHVTDKLTAEKQGGK